ncbi:MAG: hypothetical protein RI897_4204 [Verrucomicrobiota bacterium]
MKSRPLFLLALTASLLFSTPPAQADALSNLVKVLGNTDNNQLQLDILRGMSQAMEGRARVAMPEGWAAVESALGKSPQGETRMLALTLGLRFGSETALSTLRSTLTSNHASAGERNEALRALSSYKDPELPALLQSLVTDPTMSGNAIRGLAAFNNPNTPKVILAAYPELNANEKRDAASTLTSRPEYARAFMVAIEDNTIPKETLTADLLRQLRNLKDETIEESLTRVYGTFRDTPEDKKQQIQHFKNVYYAGGSAPGNASRGRVVYNNVCFQCHTLYGVGGKVGPDITGSNRGDLDYLLETVVDPNAVIPNEYRAVEVEMKDGRSLTGIIKNQDGTTITLATANETLVLPREDIEDQYQSQLSMMPEGLLDPLKEQEIRDLIYYLRLPNQAPLPEE